METLALREGPRLASQFGARRIAVHWVIGLLPLATCGALALAGTSCIKGPARTTDGSGTAIATNEDFHGLSRAAVILDQELLQIKEKGLSYLLEEYQLPQQPEYHHDDNIPRTSWGIMSGGRWAAQISTIDETDHFFFMFTPEWFASEKGISADSLVAAYRELWKLNHGSDFTEEDAKVENLFFIHNDTGASVQLQKPAGVGVVPDNECENEPTYIYIDN